jgi:hypothetical protein
MSKTRKPTFRQELAALIRKHQRRSSDSCQLLDALDEAGERLVPAIAKQLGVTQNAVRARRHPEVANPPRDNDWLELSIC